jgi:hypothetical protein
MSYGGLRTLSAIALGVLIVGLAIAPRAAVAGSWYTLSTDEKQLVLVDLETIRPLPGGTFEVSQVQVYSDAALLHMPGVTLPIRRQNLDVEIDCQKKQSRLLGMTFYSESRDPIGHGTASGPSAAWMAKGSGYATAPLFDVTCGKKPSAKDIHPEQDILQLQKLYVTATSEKPK